MADKEKILLGSGKLYLAELSADGAIPAEIAIESNSVGDISGGAQLEYKPTVYDVVNDDNIVRKSFITKEDVILKSGVLTWDMENLSKLTLGSTYTSVAGAAGKPATKTITIGGKKSIKQYAISFVHEEDDFKVTVTLKGNNQKGITLKFDPKKETIADAEFKAIANSAGTYVTIVEESKIAV